MSTDFVRQLALERRKQEFASNLRKVNRGSGWDPITSPVDYYLLNGVRSPGIVTFPSLEASEKWEQITGPGLAGAIPIFRGIQCSEFEAVHKLYDKNDWVRFHAFKALIRRAPRGKRPQAMMILHPLLSLFDPPIRSVVKTSWKLNEPDDKGVWTLVVRYTEYFKLKPQQAKPEAAKPEPVADPWEKKIDEQAAENAKLAKKLGEQ